MRKLVALLLLLTIAVPVRAEIPWGGLTDLISEKVREAKVGYIATWREGKPKHSGTLYLPINTLHSKKKTDLPVVEYLEWGLGAEKEGGYSPILPIMANAPAVANRIFRGKFWTNHVRTTNLPPIWIGPVLRIPTNISASGLRSWKLWENVGISLAIEMGAVEMGGPVFGTKKDPE